METLTAMALVVDHNTHMRELIAGMLRLITNRSGNRRLFKEIRKAATFRIALDVLSELNAPQLVVCSFDLEQLRMEGLDLLKHCYQENRLRSIPFVVTSAAVDEKQLRAQMSACREWGTSYFIRKPFQPSVLEEMVYDANFLVHSEKMKVFRRLIMTEPVEAVERMGKMEKEGQEKFTANYLNLMGEKYWAMGKFSDAEHYYQLAVNEDSGFLAAMRNLAEVKKRLRKNQEARILMEILNRYSPLDLDRKLKLAHIMIQMGDVNEGLVILQQAISLGRELGQGRELEQQIQSLTKQIIPANGIMEAVSA